MVLFRLALLTQVSIAGDCAFAGQRCHFTGEDLGQLQVSQFAGDCVHLQGRRIRKLWPRAGGLGTPPWGGGPSLVASARQEAGEPQACHVVQS